MVNKTVPEYLSNLVPSYFGQTHQYSTQNNYNLVHVHSRTAYYNNSFLPSTVRLWNELPANIKSNVSVNSMKLFLNNTIHPVPSYFYAGSRIGQILHTRIRTESSALKDHLYKKNIEVNPYCSCKLAETSEHFILRDRPFNLKGGGYGFLFGSEYFFRTIRELEYLFFFVAQSAKFFFQNSTLGYMTKTLNQIFFFPSIKVRIFFSATLGIRIIF